MIKAKAKKLPSGSWRCQVYDYTDSSGKRHYQSFTSDTPGPARKREAEYMAAEFARTKEIKIHTDKHITFQEGMKQYITIKSNVLSPSTMREYERMAAHYYSIFENKPLSKISNIDIQRWVNSFASTHSPKTIRNAYGFLFAVFSMFKYKDAITDITMPQSKKPILYTPSESGVKSILAYVKGTYLETAICLAAFGPLRRGEICPLELSDIEGNNIYSRLVPLTPDSITKRFGETIKTVNVPSFRFHDLRHYGASILHAIGIPDEYIIQRGGWATDNIMKSIYHDAISDETSKMNKKSTAILKLCNTKCNTKN